MNSLICGSVPGSCPKNWLQGNRRICRLSPEYFFATAANSL